MAMMSDAISHSILPGIVIAFFLTGTLSSPLLIIGAALMGVLTVILVETVMRTRLVKEDAAIGLIFPFLFSIGVILIARYAGDVHLDMDAVLLGELAFAPFDRWVMGDVDMGPRALYLMSGVGVINLLFLVIFYKELKLATFDTALATTLGFVPVALHYGLMSLVSLTAVAAFDAVGSILVVAFMVAPPAAAYLMTDRLDRMIILSVLIGGISAVGGYWLAEVIDASIAGCMATTVGILFGVSFLFAPHRGIVAVLRRRVHQRWLFAQKMLVIHLLQHEGRPEAEYESRIGHLQEHLQWSKKFGDRVLSQSVQRKLLQIEDGNLILTEKGRALAREAIVQT